MTIDWNFDDFNLENVASGAGAEYLPPTDETEDSGGLGWPYVKIMQSNSTLAGYRKGIGSGLIAVGRNESVEGVQGSRFVGYLFEPGKFGFFLLDPLTTGKANERLGARALWDFKPSDGSSAYEADSENKKPLCKSADGKAPISSNIGKMVRLPDTHPQGGSMVVIGLSSVIPADVVKNGGSFDVTFPPADAVCENCPLSKWWKPKGKEKSAPPLCGQKFSFVIYIPSQPAMKLNDAALAGKTTKNMDDATFPGGFAVLQGTSKSVHAALMSGDGNRSPMKSVSGKEIRGIFSFFARNADGKRVLIEKAAMPATLKQAVKGFAKADGVPVETAVPSELTAMALNPEFTHVWVEVPTFKYAADGLPQHVGIEAALPGMRYMNMNLVESSWTNNPLVPDLFLDSAEVLHEDVEAWLKAGREYKELNARDKLMFPENLQNVAERLSAGAGNWRALLPSEAAGALPAGSTVVEGEVVEDLSLLDDM